MKKYSAMILIALMLVFLMAPFADAASSTVYKKLALTTGCATCLDGIDGSALLASDMAFTTVGNVVYVHILDASNNSAESSPAIITPDSNPGVKRWILQNTSYANQVFTAPNIGAATGTSVSVTGDVSGATVKGVVPNQIIGDGTAGRVLRAATIYLGKGTTAGRIKCDEITTVWNGDTLGTGVDDISPNVPTTYWSLNTTGTALIWLNAAISGDAVYAFAVISGNATGTAMTVSAVKGATGIALYFYNATTAAAVDISTLLDAAYELIIQLFYITSG